MHKEELLQSVVLICWIDMCDHFKDRSLYQVSEFCSIGMTICVVPRGTLENLVLGVEKSAKQMNNTIFLDG